jgi:hypothetical protein
MNRWPFSVAVFFISICCSQLRVDAGTVTVSIHNEPSVNVPVHFAGGEWRVGSPGNETFFHQTGDGQVTMFGALDPDPMITFGAAVIDFGTPSPFSFTYILPLADQGSLVRDSIAGSVANGTGGGVTVTALAPPAGIPVDADGIPEVQVYTLSNNGGTTWQNVGLDLMPTSTPPLVGGSGVIGPFSEGPIATIPGGPWTHMRADINFRLTGGNDAFTFSGSKRLVPEPGAVALLLVALATCCFSRRLTIR